MMMSGQPINHAQAKALAKLIHELRPDWDESGVIHFLGKTRERAVPADEVCHAAIRAAMSAHNRSPAVIPMEGPHWQPAAGETASTSRRFGKDEICRTCGYPEPRCRQIAQLPDDGHEFESLTSRPPNVDPATGELVVPPVDLAPLRDQLTTDAAIARARGALPEVPERTSQEPPAPDPEPADTTEGDS